MDFSPSFLGKVLRGVFLLVGVLCFVGLAMAQIPERPSPPHLVTDMAGILSAEEQQALEQKLLTYEDSTSTQIAVVTVASLEEYPVEQFAVELALKWGIGQKGKNNGVLLLIAPKERRMTIQTGYGIEARLPDALTARIIDEDLKPAFRKEAYYQGIDRALDDMIRALAGEYKGDPRAESGDEGGPGGFVIILIVFIVLILIIIRSSGGGRGGRTIGGNRSRGGWMPPIFFGGGGSNWGGGSSWGGGGGGGSFGGFGGGSFGGGGSSGSW